jgi:cell filamentation protein
MIDETRIDQRFTPDYLRRMHRVWLEEIYVWAGEYRQVNMAKGSFMFAAANQVPKLIHEFGRSALRDYAPCIFDDEGELVTALAVVHAEFILIHPFAKGMGAVAAYSRSSLDYKRACRC